jgi:hypothetical protein
LTPKRTKTETLLKCIAIMCDNVYTNSILCSHNLDILNIPNAFSNLTNNKMKLGIAMMLIASLSAALLVIPSKVAIAQTSPQNQTMSGNQTMPGNQTATP